jgi:DNA-binding FrmR family transcriptional regulator
MPSQDRQAPEQAHGQLASILQMFAEGRSCVDLARQLQAVESIVHLAKRALIKGHMEGRIGDTLNDGGMTAKQALSEFKSLSKYL